MGLPCHANLAALAQQVPSSATESIRSGGQGATAGLLRNNIGRQPPTTRVTVPRDTRRGLAFCVACARGPGGRGLA